MPACEPEAARLGGSGSGWGWGGGSFVARAHPAPAAHCDRDLDPGRRAWRGRIRDMARKFDSCSNGEPSSARPLVILSMSADPF